MLWVILRKLGKTRRATLGTKYAPGVRLSITPGIGPSPLILSIGVLYLRIP